MAPRILLIEKDPCIASLLSYPLLREGYEIACMDALQPGFSEAKRMLYDLIVYDMEQPAHEETEFLQKLRHHHIHTPVLILSANADEAHIAACLRTGAEDYIVKPFVVETFLARIYAILRRRNHIDTNQTVIDDKDSKSIEVGNLHIFPDKYEVQCNGNTLTFPKTEFELLVYLAERKGAVVSRNELACKFWYTINPKNCRKVDVYISSIRKKLESFTAVSIQAVRGRGYKIISS